MKILAFSDVHGNQVALKSLIESNDFKTADKVIFLGDIVNMSPATLECIKLIKKHCDIIIMGNHDSWILNGLGADSDLINESFLTHLNHTKDLVTKSGIVYPEGDRDYYLTLGNHALYFCHFVWEGKNEIADIPQHNIESDMVALFRDIKADYIFYGHEHTPFKFEKFDKKFFGIGSLGAIWPGAYAVIEAVGDKINVKSKELNYDVNLAIKEILDSDYPFKEYVAGQLNLYKQKRR